MSRRSAHLHAGVRSRGLCTRTCALHAMATTIGHRPRPTANTPNLTKGKAPSSVPPRVAPKSASVADSPRAASSSPKPALSPLQSAGSGSPTASPPNSSWCGGEPRPRARAFLAARPVDAFDRPMAASRTSNSASPASSSASCGPALPDATVWFCFLVAGEDATRVRNFAFWGRMGVENASPPGKICPGKSFLGEILGSVVAIDRLGKRELICHAGGSCTYEYCTFDL